MSNSPDALLKSALEKIVYFEARSTQLSNDLEHTRVDAERLKGDLSAAAQREIELRRVIAELEVRSTRAHSEREDSARVAEALRRERAELIGKMLEASRIQRSGQELEDFDLAQFISELRSEVLFKREGSQMVPVNVSAAAPTTATSTEPVLAPARGPTTVNEVAQSLQSQGRLEVSAAQLAELGGAQAFPGRSEETLFGFSVRELSAPDAPARARAADRLKALAHPAAAPALATALNVEREPAALVAMLGALAALAKAEAVPVVQPHLTSSAPDVRIAALKALISLEASQAGPHLAAAMKDPDKAVRRRASLLALGLTGTAAYTLGEEAIRDVDADVRSLAALVLGASGAESARSLLLEAMRDVDTRVRQSASQAMSRLLGRDVTGLVSLDAAQRRREVRRLVNEPANPVMSPSARIAERLSAARAPERAHSSAAVVASPAREVNASAERLQVAASTAQAERGRVMVASHAPSAHADGVASRPTSSAHLAEPTRAAKGIADHPGAAMPSTVSPQVTQTARASSLHHHLAASQPTWNAHGSASNAVAEHHHAPTTHAQGAAAMLAPAAASATVSPVGVGVFSAPHAAASMAHAMSRVAVVDVVEAQVPDALLDGLLGELRTSIRGRPLDELVSTLGTSSQQTLNALSTLMQRGHVLRRGHKYFVA